MTRRSLHILVGEDDASLSVLYGAYASHFGHRVTLARDGVEALAAAARIVPDVIFLDVSMPRLDGREVLRELAADPKMRRIPVIVISAQGGDQATRDELFELGAWEVLVKPVDLEVAFAKAELLANRAARGL